MIVTTVTVITVVTNSFLSQTLKVDQENLEWYYPKHLIEHTSEGSFQIRTSPHKVFSTNLEAKFYLFNF
jgi:hypothetical protein